MEALSLNMREELEERRASLASDRKLLLTEAASLTGQIAAIDRLLDPDYTERRGRVLRALRTVEGPMTFKTLHEAVGMEIRPQRLSEILTGLVRAGLVERPERGVYRIVDRQPEG